MPGDMTTNAFNTRPNLRIMSLIISGIRDLIFFSIFLQNNNNEKNINEL